MPADSPRVADAALPDLVRRILADVMMVPVDRVKSDSALIADLGGESIDFLDVVFHLEDNLGLSIANGRWESFLRRRHPAGNIAFEVTTASVLEFAREQLAEAGRE